MLKIEAVAKVYHTCTLTDEEEQKVLDYIKNNEEEFKGMSSKKKITEAVEILYGEDEIDLYKNATESDFSTDEINWSEFEERDAYAVLNNEHS